MPNGTQKPEFHIDCVWCGGSFSATADTLRDLVEMVELHIKQMKANDEPHKEYLAKHPNAKLPNTIPEILSSPAFKWAIERLVPFNEIFELFKISPFPPIQSWLVH